MNATTSRTTTTRTVRSADGTRTTFERLGDGPPLLLVEPAGHFRKFSAFSGLVPLLAREFTVLTYDRRGRGESTDTPPYAPDREVEDMAGLIEAACGSADVYAYSSGALLAMRAAARGLAIPRLAVLEPPLKDNDAPSPDPLTIELTALVDAGRNAEAVERFHESIGVPAEYIEQMRSTPQWDLMVSIARTLVYDCVISDTTSTAMLRSVQVPTLVLDSEGSSDNLTGWAARVARLLPRANHRSLAGEWHAVPDDALALVLIEFFLDRRRWPRPRA